MDKENLPFITAAACLDIETNVIYTYLPPKRHHDIIHQIPGNHENIEQGFITNTGQFLNRWQARKLAIENGQVLKPKHDTELFSEDLW